MKTSIKTGTVVYCEFNDELKAGIVLRSSEKAKRISVLANSGNVEDWSLKNLFYVTCKNISLYSGKEKESLSYLIEFGNHVSELVKQVDASVIWEILSEQGKRTYSDLQIAQLVFSMDNPSAEHLAGIRIGLRNSIYFRVVEDGFIPNQEKTVTSLLREQKNRAEEEDLINTAALEIRRLMRKEMHVQDLSRTGAAGMKLIEGVAVSGVECDHFNRACEIIERISPCFREDPANRAVEILVKAGIFREDENLLLKKFNIRINFSSHVLEEAKKIQEMAESAPFENSLNSLRIFSIDDEETRDIDDAVAVEDTGTGKKRIHVIISDVASLINFESACAREALRRCSSLYLPDGRIPMFPEVLSDDTLSLVRGKNRGALDFSFEFEKETGGVKNFTAASCRVKISDRLTYGEVDSILSGEKSSDRELADAIFFLNEISRIHRNLRLKNGAIIIKRDEVKIRLRDNGEIEIKRINNSAPSRNLVSELMIMTCTSAAEYLKNHGIPAVYRRQMPPSSLNSVSEQDHLSPVYSYQMIRMMSRAELTTIPCPHAGLGVSAYTQVTSPIRRCQDYLTHLQLRNYLIHGHALFSTEELLRNFGDLELNMEIHAKIDRERKKYFILKHLAKRIGEEIPCIVLAEQGKKHVVELVDYALDIPLALAFNPSPGERISPRLIEVIPRKEIVIVK
jgi:exoribonuclease-2